MKTNKKIIFLFLIYSLYYPIEISANIISDSSNRKYHTTVHLKVGSAFFSTGAEFFEIYENEFGGLVNYFKTFPEAGLAVKVQLDDVWRLSISADYTEARINDAYFQEETSFGNKYIRFIGQDLTFRQLPILLNLEYNPYWLTQFRTFTGVGLGINANYTMWNEKVNSNQVYDKRKSGTKYNELDILAAFRIYAAVDLGFDKKTLDHFLASLILQVSYTGFLGNIDLFNEVKGEFENKPLSLENKVIPISGYFAVCLSLSFNFNKKEKSPKGNLN